MYPLTYSYELSNVKRKITYDEFKQKMSTLKKVFKVPVFLLGEQQHIKKLCQEIIDFLIFN